MKVSIKYNTRTQVLRETFVSNTGGLTIVRSPKRRVYKNVLKLIVGYISCGDDVIIEII